MIIIFGTTNDRKVADLRKIIEKLEIDVEVKSLADIGWTGEEIDETGQTLEENSLIKAMTIYEFCNDKGLEYPILTDDSGLFVEHLNGEPGVHTGRYADEERAKDPTLPKYECVNKLMRKLNGVTDRKAHYRCVVTCIYPDGTYFQESGVSDGTISYGIVDPIKKPYFYSVFKLANTTKTFNLLRDDELKDTYRYQALNKVLRKIK